MSNIEPIAPSFPKNPVLNERYRPNTVADCILPEGTRKIFDKMVGTGHIDNMLFAGSAGTGKTTLAKALCEQLGVEYIFINASDERGLDVIRTRIANFAGTVSITGKRKCVILDEADQLPMATQGAFRNALESLSRNCAFILTCNYPNQIIDPIRSRLVEVDFAVDDSTRIDMMMLVFDRVQGILKNEGIAYEETPLLELVNALYPDNRRLLNIIDHYSKMNGTIDVGILESIKDVSIDSLVDALKAADFKTVRTWCAEAAANNVTNIYGKLYRILMHHVEGDSIPELIITINDAQRYDDRVPDKELHLTAMCVELLSECTFKD